MLKSLRPRQVVVLAEYGQFLWMPLGPAETLRYAIQSVQHKPQRTERPASRSTSLSRS